MSRILMACALALAPWVAGALDLPPPNAQRQGVDQAGQLQDPALQSRYEYLTHQLRCLVCQNQSVADSDAFLAKDLRNQVREMLVAGKTDDTIMDFMTARYGEFVRYSPPLEAKTLLIWGAPFILLFVGAIVVVRVARQRAAMPLDDDAQASQVEAAAAPSHDAARGSSAAMMPSAPGGAPKAH